jgi:hypothetical protein
VPLRPNRVADAPNLEIRYTANVKRRDAILALIMVSAAPPVSVGWAQQTPHGGDPATVAAIEQTRWST